jgi:excisionase family DNA binding protein
LDVQDEEVSVDTGDRLLTPGEVAALFRVDPKTVTRWAAAGRIGSIRTPGGHRRFRESEVRALLEGGLDFEEEQPPPSTGTSRQPSQ